MTNTRRHSLTLTTLTLAALTSALAACAGSAPQTATPANPVTTTAPTTAPTQATAPDAVAVRATLAARRQLQINRLRAYRNAGAFPINREQPGKLNIFIDDDGAICAAANLMWQDGKSDLVRKTALADNYLRLVTVTEGPLMSWMLTSGLTQHEIDRIQEPYMMIEEPEPGPQIAAEVDRLQKHFDLVLAELERDAEASLDAATALVMAQPALLAAL